MKGKKDGDKVVEIIFLDGTSITPAAGTFELELLNSFHGEYDIDWIIEKHAGTEVARHNCKLIRTIRWKT